MSAHPTYFLPIQDVDKADKIVLEAQAVADLLQRVDCTELNDNTLSSVGMLLKDMFGELQSITSRQR